MKASISLFSFLLIGLLLCTACDTLAQTEPCGGISPGIMTYSSGSYTISPTVEKMLQELADQMRANPACKVVVTGGAGGSKYDQELSWLRVYDVIDRMSEKYNIDRNRFIFNYQGSGPVNQIICRGAYEGEEGPSNEAEPHPGLIR